MTPRSGAGTIWPMAKVAPFILAVLLLVGCSSTKAGVGAGPTTVTVTATAASSTSAAATTTSGNKSAAVTWCSLTLGEQKASVVSAMGAPNGHKSDQYSSQLPQGQTYAEWDVGADVLLATFDASGAAVHLQAYDGDIGPVGAKDIACAPFRNAAS